MTKYSTVKVIRVNLKKKSSSTPLMGDQIKTTLKEKV